MRYVVRTKRVPEELVWDLEPTLAPSYLNYKFHLISDILLSHYAYSETLKMDVEEL